MIRLAVRCAPDRADEVLAELLVLAPNGVEEEHGPGWVEYAIYGGPGEVPELGELKAASGDGLVEVSSTEVPDDWADRWADFHQPIQIGGSDSGGGQEGGSGLQLRVRPSWEPALEGPDAPVDVMVDPGRAFGTGAHATTRLCLELLLESAPAATGPLADWGSGSGVLAIAAAKLGWGPVSACDREPAALEAMQANAEANGVELEIHRVDVRENDLPRAPAVVANLTAPLLRACAESLTRSGWVPDLLICSGMLHTEVDAVREAFEAAGLAHEQTRTDGDWSSMRLARAD